jgi:hypothetical protein
MYNHLAQTVHGKPRQFLHTLFDFLQLLLLPQADSPLILRFSCNNKQEAVLVIQLRYIPKQSIQLPRIPLEVTP